MNRFRLSFSSLAIGSLLGITLVAAGPAIADTASQLVRGGAAAGKVAEPRFIYTENNGPIGFIEVERSLVKLPLDYGEPFAVTSISGNQSVWYRHPELGVRNVIIQGDRTLIHLLKMETIKKSEAPTSGTR